MSATAAVSTGPAKMDPKTDKGVHIIMLSASGVLGEMIARRAPEDDVMLEASRHVVNARKTDIVVFNHKPWHMVNGCLRPHPQVHDEDKETILDLSFKAQNRAVWWSEQPFTITRVDRSDHHPAAHGSPAYPFPTAPPYVARSEEDIHNRPIFVVRSEPIVQAAVGQMYKIMFFMGEDIDPDMSCNP